jgi:hypothetical protein
MRFFFLANEKTYLFDHTQNRQNLRRSAGKISAAGGAASMPSGWIPNGINRRRNDTNFFYAFSGKDDPKCF